MKNHSQLKKLYPLMLLFGLLIISLVVASAAQPDSTRTTLVDTPAERVSCARTRNFPESAYLNLGIDTIVLYYFSPTRETNESSTTLQVTFALRVSKDDDIDLIQSRLTPLINDHPGARWLIGNEIDRYGQDGMLPEEYPVVYHQYYSFIKHLDSSAQVGNASIIQPTPLRLEYMDRVWDAYIDQYGHEMPVDFWNIHNMILREEAGVWGASIPPGIDAQKGILYEVSDNNNVAAFIDQLVAFRQWMADKGQRDKPLYVSEFGILMPPQYGFEADVVNSYIQATFDYMLYTTDDELGYPADGNRLVQWWTWFSCDDKSHDFETATGFNGGLLDYETGELTDIGRYFQSYLAADLAIENHQIIPAQTSRRAATIEFDVVNTGLNPADAFTVELWLGRPDDGGTLIDSTRVTTPLLPNLYEAHTQPLSFPITDTDMMTHPLYVVIDAGGEVFESNEENNLYSTVSATYMPLLTR